MKYRNAAIQTIKYDPENVHWKMVDELLEKIDGINKKMKDYTNIDSKDD